MDASKIQISPGLCLVAISDGAQTARLRDTQFFEQRKQFFHLSLNKLSGPKEQTSGQVQKFPNLAAHWVHQGWGWDAFKNPSAQATPKPIKTESLGMGPRPQHLYKLPGDSNGRTGLRTTGAGGWERESWRKDSKSCEWVLPMLPLQNFR